MLASLHPFSPIPSFSPSRFTLPSVLHFFFLSQMFPVVANVNLFNRWTINCGVHFYVLFTSTDERSFAEYEIRILFYHSE